MNWLRFLENMLAVSLPLFLVGVALEFFFGVDALFFGNGLLAILVLVCTVAYIWLLSKSASAER